MVDLNKAFEVDDGIKVGGVTIPSSVVGLIRSAKPTYSSDTITSIEYFNSLTQTNANRILKCNFTYAADLITVQTNTYYQSDGVTVHQTETINYTYSSGSFSKIEVT